MQVAVTNPSLHLNRWIAVVSMLVAVLAQVASANSQTPQQHPHPQNTKTTTAPKKPKDTQKAPVSQQSKMPRAQKHDARHEIDKLEETWRSSILKGNSVAMKDLLADNYVAITSRGTIQTKEQALARLDSGRAHYTSLELSDIKVRFYGTTALVTSLAQVTGSNADGEDISGSFRYTRVYARDAQGNWKIVSFEASRIRQPGERR
jgi:ketosteroid isomerase-like protein